MAKARKLTIGKTAFTVFGGQGEVTKVAGKTVTIKGMFGDETLQLDEVYHSRATAWGTHRAV